MTPPRATDDVATGGQGTVAHATTARVPNPSPMHAIETVKQSENNSRSRGSHSSAPPGYLSLGAKRLWRSVVAEAAFSFESHHLKQLEIACAALDRAEKARHDIDQAGQMIAGRYGFAVNPLIAVERESQRTVLRALASLHLDAPIPEPSPGRPGPRGAAQ